MISNSCVNVEIYDMFLHLNIHYLCITSTTTAILAPVRGPLSLWSQPPHFREAPSPAILAPVAGPLSLWSQPPHVRVPPLPSTLEYIHS